MNAREYLEQFSKYDLIISSKIDEINELKQKAVNVSVNYGGERVTSSRKNDPQGDMVAVYVSLEQELEEEMKTVLRAKWKALRILEKLPCTEYIVLYERFLNNKNLYEIASEHSRSYSYVAQASRNGIKHLQELLDLEKQELQ